MSHFILSLPTGLISDIGWTLIHFLWQGLALVALLYLALPLFRRATTRHDLALGTLILMAMAPLATFAFLHFDNSSPASTITAGALPDTTVSGAGTVAATIPVAWTTWLVALWLGGIAVLSLRAIGGWFVVRSWRSRETSAVPAALLARCRTLQTRLSMSRPVQFLQSRRIRVPMVIGLFKPAVLIPLSAVTGMPPQQLDTLILHELAHIARLDAVANVILVAVETTLFYHPAVWWVGRVVRAEREHCCDDVAVSFSGNVATYVEALISLEAGRNAPAFGLAASGGKLKARVSRLLGQPSEARRAPLAALVGLALLGLVVASTATAQTTPGHQTISIRVVDDVRGGQHKGDDRVALAKASSGEQALWLKREGQIGGNVVTEAHVITGENGHAGIAFRLTPEAAVQFRELTQNNVGHRLAIVIANRVITAPVLKDPIASGNVEITGKFASEAEAQAVIAEMMGKAPANTR